MDRGCTGAIRRGYTGGTTPKERGYGGGCQGGAKTGANGGIGRGELCAVSVGLCLAGPVLSGGVVLPQAWPGWLAFWLVGLLIWGGQALWVQLFAGLPLADVMTYALGRAAGRCLLFALALAWLVPAAGGAVGAVQLWQALGFAGTGWLHALLFLLVVGLMAAAGVMALARVALLVVLPALVLVPGNLALTLGGADWANLLPLADVGWATDVACGLNLGLLLFGGLTVLPAFWGDVQAAKRRLGSLFAAMCLAAAVAVLLALGCRVVLATLLEEWTLPLVQVFRLAQLGHWFARFEVLGAGLLLALLLVRTAAALGGALAALGYLWRVQSLRGRLLLTMVLAVGLLPLALGWRDDWLALWDELSLWAAALAAAVPWAVAAAGRHKCRAEGLTVLPGQAADGENRPR